MSKVSFIDTSFIRCFDSFLVYKRYFPISNKSNIKLWVIKASTSIEHRNKILTLNGKIYININNSNYMRV